MRHLCSLSPRSLDERVFGMGDCPPAPCGSMPLRASAKGGSALLVDLESVHAASGEHQPLASQPGSWGLGTCCLPYFFGVCGGGGEFLTSLKRLLEGYACDNSNCSNKTLNPQVQNCLNPNGCNGSLEGTSFFLFFLGGSGYTPFNRPTSAGVSAESGRFSSAPSASSI